MQSQQKKEKQERLFRIIDRNVFATTISSALLTQKKNSMIVVIICQLNFIFNLYYLIQNMCGGHDIPL